MGRGHLQGVGSVGWEGFPDFFLHSARGYRAFNRTRAEDFEAIDEGGREGF